jgi:hypothetical protein
VRRGPVPDDEQANRLGTGGALGGDGGPERRARLRGLVGGDELAPDADPGVRRPGHPARHEQRQRQLGIGGRGRGGVERHHDVDAEPREGAARVRADGPAPAPVGPDRDPAVRGPREPRRGLDARLPQPPGLGRRTRRELGDEQRRFGHDGDHRQHDWSVWGTRFTAPQRPSAALRPSGLFPSDRRAV